MPGLDEVKAGLRARAAIVDWWIEIWWSYLDVVRDQGNDPADPSYLMQAYDLTKREAEAVIVQWQEAQGE